MALAGDKMESLKKALPGIKFVEPSDEAYDQTRINSMGRGGAIRPAAFAVPQNSQDVADLVRWAKTSGTDFCIRSGGNEFYNRSLIDDGLVIDMRQLKSMKISDDKKTVTFGGGIIGVDLVEAVEKEGLIVPFGNTGFVGYVGWITMGGYGPLSSTLGMGFEGLVGAEIVNAAGEIVQATDEMLEGLRGMGGNLGVVTSMTVKTYPARKFLCGPIMMEATEANIKSVVSAARSFEASSSAVIMHVLMSDMSDKTKQQLTMRLSWDGEDLTKGKEFVDEFIEAISPVQFSKVEEVTGSQFMNGPKYPALPFGGNRSVAVTEIDEEMIDVLVEGLKTKSAWGNITWADGYDIDHSKVPKNTFGPGKHALVTFSDLAPDADSHADAKKWADAFEKKLRAAKACTGMAYPALMVPGARTVEEMMGDKYKRAMELKRKFDRENVFKYAVPRLLEA